MRVKAGDKIPADLLIVDCHEMKVLSDFPGFLVLVFFMIIIAILKHVRYKYGMKQK